MQRDARDANQRGIERRDLQAVHNFALQRIAGCTGVDAMKRLYVASRTWPGLCLGVKNEQVHEWPAKEPHLRRANPVFISRRMIEAHRGA